MCDNDRRRDNCVPNHYRITPGISVKSLHFTIVMDEFTRDIHDEVPLIRNKGLGVS